MILAETHRLFQSDMQKWDFPGGPVVKTALPVKGVAWVRTLARGLKIPCALWCSQKKKFFLMQKPQLKMMSENYEDAGCFSD